jgi:hypothetical protein
MGISTTGFVLTKNKDVFAVLTTIEDTLAELINKYAKDSIWLDDDCKLPIIECCARGRYFAIKFKIKNENRMLMVHFDCDCDYKE